MSMTMTQKAGFMILGLGFLLGCNPRNPYTRSYLSDRVKAQSAFDVTPKKEAGKFTVPPSVQMTDGISEDEAVAIALWNNEQYQADLAGISFAAADVKDAGIIQNPLLQYLSPNGGIVAQGYLYFYLDNIWQRPHRVAAAKRDAKKVAENLVQRSFTLIRDVQMAYADLALAKTRVDILSQNSEIRNQMSQLAGSRLRHGDISELEATTARIDSINAADVLLRAVQDTLILRLRFNVLLGVSSQDTVINLRQSPSPDFKPASKRELIEMAYTYQPELAAAKSAIEAAGQRIGWERSRIAVFTGVLNGQNFAGTPSAEKQFPETFNLGLRTEVPVFNWNQGRISRAKAELEQASHNYVAIRQRVALNVSEAYARYETALKSYQLWNSNVLPSLEQAVLLSQNSYGTGDVSYLPVLEATRQMLDAKLRKSEVEAELRRAVSQLNFSLGKRIIN
jgi:cobalt-zinc-cadmium efflux system outer membrane protein